MSAAPHGNFSSRNLVVFGCGYIGSAVVARATAVGMRVTALTRNHETASRLRGGKVTVVEADLADAGWHGEIPHPADFVLNCVSSGGGGIAGYRHSYGGGMASILRWAEQGGGVGTLVYTSSTSVYPQGGGAVVDEAATTHRPAAPVTDDDVPESADGRGQILAGVERLLMDTRGARRRWFVLRLAGIYGPERCHLLEQVRSGTVAGAGEHRLNIAYRDDIVDAVFAAFGAPEYVRDEVFNIADDKPARKADIAGWLAERLGCAPPVFSGAPAGGRRAITPDRVISNRKAKEILGWRPRHPTYREGYDAILGSEPCSA